MTSPIVKIADNNDKVAEELIKVVKDVADQSADDVIKIGLSGGSLPKFLAAGMKSDIGKSIPWSKVKFFFCDERMVPTEDADSTLGLYLSLFKSLDDIKAEQFVSVAVDLDVDQAAADYEDKLKSLMGTDVQADLLLLGMGPDGHTCSLFPNHELLEEKDKIVASIKDSPKAPPQRYQWHLHILINGKYRTNIPSYFQGNTNSACAEQS